MRLGEITYTEQEKQSPSFKDLHLIRSDITFSESDQYAILRLKRSKTDAKHTGVLIMLAATNSPCCPVQTLRRLFTYDPSHLLHHCLHTTTPLLQGATLWNNSVRDSPWQISPPRSIAVIVLGVEQHNTPPITEC